MLALLSNVGNAAHQVKLSLEMLDYARESEGASQVSSFWLSFELTKAALHASSDIDDFFDFSSVTETFEDPKAALDELYAYSSSLLDAYGEPSDADWEDAGHCLGGGRLCSVPVQGGLQTRAHRCFVPHCHLARIPRTRIKEPCHHNPSTCSPLTAAYTSVSELIVGNADYMVNSISLRMNTLDITPASTRVLIMMTRLTGPRLIPYLDDVVASIFAALDNYHGYPVFVESLFAVLREVVEQGVKSTKLLEDGRETNSSGHRKQRPAATNLEGRAKPPGHPQTTEKGNARRKTLPWPPSTATHLGLGAPRRTAPQDPADDEPSTELEKEKPPKTPTYILLEKVASLTQHYLTSPTPTLRKSLLDLLSSVSPALARDEDALPPLGQRHLARHHLASSRPGTLCHPRRL